MSGLSHDHDSPSLPLTVESFNTHASEQAGLALLSFEFWCTRSFLNSERARNHPITIVTVLALPTVTAFASGKPAPAVVLRGLTLQYQHGGLAPLASSVIQACSNPYLVFAAEETEPNWPNHEDHHHWLKVYRDPLRDESGTQENHNPDERVIPTTLVTIAQETQLAEDEQMKARTKKTLIGVLSTLIAYVSLNSLFRATNPELFIWCEEDREDATWIATSKSWVDKKVCRWLGICGGQHMHWARRPFGISLPSFGGTPSNDSTGWDWHHQWVERKDQKWSPEDRAARDIPHYVLEYAPLVHLFSGEQFWPGDIAEHLFHTTPTLNYTPIQSRYQHPTLSNLDNLNQWEGGQYVFLTSNDNPEERPEWLEGAHNIPKEIEEPFSSNEDEENLVHQPGKTLNVHDRLQQSLKDLDDIDDSVDTSDPIVEQLQHQATELLRHELKRREALAPPTQGHKVHGGRSEAPAILITVNKPNGVVDAFWFFFYSFNLGNAVLNVRFGNHVGDWEHSAVRFKHGKPIAVYFSEHNFGSAYTYEAVEKIGKRPVIYSATGSHAMYATPGLHPYVLPWGILHDETDRGPLWDPALNHHSYTYNYTSDELLPSSLTPDSPTGWFHFAGHWGDKFYPLGDRRQYRFAGQYHYVNGPLGPKFKNLARKAICGGPDGTPCHLKHYLDDGGKISRTAGYGEESDEWSVVTKKQFRPDLQALNMLAI